MSKTRLKKTLFLTSIFLRFGSQLGSQIRKSNSKNRLFSVSWANLGQLGHKRRSKTPQEVPQESANETKRCLKRAKLTPQSVPRHPQDPQGVFRGIIVASFLKRFIHESFQSQHEAKMYHTTFTLPS